MKVVLLVFIVYFVAQFALWHYKYVKWRNNETHKELYS